MENFEEVKNLLAEKKIIEEYQSRIKTIGFRSLSNGGSKEYIMIVNNNNGRYHFDGIANIIGHEKMEECLQVFESLISNELNKAKEQKEKELSVFSINKKS